MLAIAIVSLLRVGPSTRWVDRLLRAHHRRPLAYKQALGVSYSGATYKFTVLDTLGRRVAQQGEWTGRLWFTGPMHSCSAASDRIPCPGHALLVHRSRAHKQLCRGKFGHR